MDRRRGRRDNGLEAADFAAVGDLDPRLAEHLLDLLGAHGIAAYLQPSMDINPITRSSTVPARPTDRLYADRAHLGTARDYLRRLLSEERTTEQEGRQFPAEPQPETSTGGGDASGAGGQHPGGDPPPPATSSARPAGSQLDATFEGIVADFDQPVDPTAASWPAAENLPASRARPEPDTDATEAAEPPPRAEPPRSGPVDARQVTEPSLLDGLDTFGADLPDEEPAADERFVPPPPPPLPRLSRQAVLGGLAILIGLVLLLAPGLGPFSRTDSLLLGFICVLGGAVALILRLRPGTDPDEDQRPDDGARV